MKKISLYYTPTTKCNLNCSYCYIKNELYDKHIDHTLDIFNLKTDIENIKKFAIDTNSKLLLKISGGECLLIGSENLKKLIDELDDHLFSVGIQTNLLLLDNTFIDIIKGIKKTIHGFKFSTSLDFPRRAHNKYRNNSFDKVTSNLKVMKDNGIEEAHIISCLHKDNLKDIDSFKKDILDFQKDFPNARIDFYPIYHNEELTLSSEEQIKFANEILSLGFYTKELMIGMTNRCIFSKTCAQIQYGSNKFGMCNRIIGSINTTKLDIPFVEVKKNIDKCSKCNIRNVCGGGCPMEKKDGNWIFCSFWKTLFKDIGLDENINSITS